MELSGIRYLDSFNFEQRTVFVRVDFNVPMKNGSITDDARITAAIPTIARLRAAGNRVVLASHLGRPKDKPQPEFSLEPVAAHLASLLDADVLFSDDCVGDGVRKAIRDLPFGGVCLLENLRFRKAETAGENAFAQELAANADVYVNDAFGAAHRAHASTYTMVQYFDEGKRFAGLLVEKELKNLGPLLHGAEKPFVGIIGGAKVSDKIKVLDNLIGKLDTMLIGGAMAYTFLAAKGITTGKSLVEGDQIETARNLLRAGESFRTEFVLPIDHIVASSIDAPAGDVTLSESIPVEMAGFDIGPKTIELFTKYVNGAATVFWNGPLGVFEKPAFNVGTFAIANALADAKCVSVVGGGDSASAIKMAGRAGDVTHVSTGGGASLEFIEGHDLPGVAALRSGHRFRPASEFGGD